MATFDWVLLLFLGGFVLAGFFAGLFQTLGAIVGAFFGYFLASRFYESLGDILQPLLFHNRPAAQAIAFLLIFLIVSRLIGLVFWVISKALRLLSLMPLFPIFNRVIGALLGFLEGIVVIGMVLSALLRIMPDASLQRLVSESELAQLLVTVGHWFGFLLPAAFRALDTYLPL